MDISFSHDEFLDSASEKLTEGVLRAKHPFHQCTVASNANGIIEQRTVVLRKWVFKRQTLMFHTDIRSPKIEQFKQNPRVSVLFYSKEDKLQLRFKCVLHVHHNDRLTNYLFGNTTESQQDCYMTHYPPSSVIDNMPSYLSSKRDAVARENFAVCVCNFDELDLLYLNQKRHSRILYSWDKHGKRSSVDLAP